MLTFHNLILETTRRCNMQCGHCLRGPAQRLNMSYGVMIALANQVDYISTLTLSGGEPSLVPDVLETIRMAFWHRDVQVGSFYVATNGKRIQRQFIDVMTSWFQTCDDNEVSRIDISNDMYHDQCYLNPGADRMEEELNWLREDLCGFKFNHEYMLRPASPGANRGYTFDYQYGLLNMGRAKKIGNQQVRQAEVEIEDNTVTEGDIYINVHGDIIPGCDYSYVEQNNVKIGNVLNGDMHDILIEFSLQQQIEKEAA